jgi:hypothetical protein
MTPEPCPTRVGQIDRTALRALLFDLDGVITRTAPRFDRRNITMDALQ